MADELTAAVTSVGCTPPENASKSSFVVPNRCAGSLESAFAIAWVIRGGRGVPDAVTVSGSGGTVMCWAAHSQGVFAVNGKCPESISYTIMPIE